MRVQEIVDKATERFYKIAADNSPLTPEDEEDTRILVSLVEIIASVSSECRKIKFSPFAYIENPDERLRDKFSKYLPVLNVAHVRFLPEKSKTE